MQGGREQLGTARSDSPVQEWSRRTRALAEIAALHVRLVSAGARQHGKAALGAEGTARSGETRRG